MEAIVISLTVILPVATVIVLWIWAMRVRKESKSERDQAKNFSQLLEEIIEMKNKTIRLLKEKEQ